MNFSNYSRDSLMRKLARMEDPADAAEKKPQKQAEKVRKAAPVEEATPSRCVLLKNVYNQAEYVRPSPPRYH